MKRTWSILLLTGALLVQAGCSSVTPNRESLALDAREKDLPRIEKPVPTLGNSQEARSESVTTAGARDHLVISDFVSSDPLPEFQVKGFSFSNASVYDVIRTMVSDRGIALSINMGSDVGAAMRRTVTAYNVSGSFADVIENLSRSIGFYYSYRDGVLNIEADREFVISLPPVAELFESIPMMLKNLGATEILLDKSSRIVTFKASKPVYARASSYLKYLRETRTLITYDTYIWEVVLNDAAKMGINWQSLTDATLASSALATGASYVGSDVANAGTFGVNISNATDATNFPGGTGVGLIYKSNNFGVNLLLQFLKTQGTVNNISQPKISLLAGSAAQFRSGDTINYISRLTNTTVAGVSGAAGTTSVTADQASVETGVTMTVTGDYADGTIFTDLNMLLRDLVSMQSVTLGTSGVINIPHTTVREVSSRVRSRPGEAMLIGGINIERADNQFAGIGPIPTSSSKSVTRSELVLVLIPKITRFVRDSNNGRTIGATP